MATNRIGFSSDFVLVNSNVGVGTTAPLQKLHVLGNLLVAAGSSTGQHITQKAYELNSGTLSWEGSAGQLFSIVNNLSTGSIFSVNDVSGIPSIDVNADGTIILASYSGNVGVGTTNPTSKLTVTGDGRFTGIVTATSFSGSLANTLTLNTSGTGLSGSTTYNNSGAATFTVTSNATSANTGSAIVARGASGEFSMGALTASTGSFSSTISPANGIYLQRVNATNTGINWYSTTYTAWTTYMGSATQTNLGPTNNITAPNGTLVTTWGLRNFIENVGGYGWTFESGTSNGQPTVVAEIRSSDGAARFGGDVSGTTLTSRVATGTAPLTVSSTTLVSNLNADLLDGLNSATANTVSTIVARDGSGNFSAGTITASLTGIASSATTFSTNRTNYAGVTDGAVSGQMMWKNYGNNHTIFDASAGTSPSGGAVDRFTPQNLVENATSINSWGYSPNLMGWNGSNTYGLRVDYARLATNISGGTVSATTGAFSSQITSTQANSTTTGGGQIYLNGATGNRIDFNTNGLGVPTLTTRSVGTKLVLYPAVDASNVDSALGMENAAFWSSVPNSASQFKWYAGTTNIATLFGTGELVLGTTSKTGTASQPLQVTGGAYVSGSVGIGTTNPTQTLHVQGNVRITGGLYDSNNNVGAASSVLISTGSGISWAAASGGGATLNNSPSGTLYPTMSSATSGTYSIAYVSSTALTFTTSTGTLSATQFTSLSDANKKKNIRPIENALEITKKLEGVRFDWIDSDAPSIGVIAQQVEKVLPELVEDIDGIKSVSYGNIVGVLIEAIKEQQVRIEELERKLNA